jgi:peroxiredoxin Q/BCP
MTPEVGQIAPEFTLPSGPDDTLSLSSLRGRPVVLYFYPRDDTSGCTLEAKDFTALAAEFRAAGARVLGVSKDSVKSHEKFSAKHALDVTLLSDEAGSVCEDYGVWREKSMYGRKFMGIERATFLIDADGRIARTWPKVTVKGHAQEVLEAVRAL